MRVRWLARRFVHALLLLTAISVLAFLMGRLAPGSFFDDLRLNPQISPETIAQLRSRYGVDRPAAVQYARWAFSAVRGEFGTSLVWQQPVAPVLWPRVRSTLQLTGGAWVLAWAVGLPLGMAAAGRRRQLADRLGGTLSSVLPAIPELLLTLGLMYFAVRMGSGWLLSSYLLPLCVLTATAFPVIFLHTRSATDAVLEAAFIRSARAHGIRGHRLWLRYILPAAGNPLISLLGLSLGGLLGGSLVVETLLSRPGVGPLFLEALAARDLDVVTAVLLLSACFLTFGNLAADILLALNDPRLEQTGGGAGDEN